MFALKKLDLTARSRETKVRRLVALTIFFEAIFCRLQSRARGSQLLGDCIASCLQRCGLAFQNLDAHLAFEKRIGLRFCFSAENNALLGNEFTM